MSKLTVTAIAILLAAAAMLGAAAVTRTMSLGAGRAKTADASIHTRIRQLDRFEAALRRRLAQKPPALPAVPKPVAAQAPAQAAPHVVYRRPAPIVVVRHLHHGDDGGESGASGGGDD